MIAILGEDSSDTDTLSVIVRRLLSDTRTAIKAKHFRGCHRLMRKGAASIDLLLSLGCTHFVICHDADLTDAEIITQQVQTKIIDRVGIKKNYCIVVPKQEIEAWLIADPQAISKAIPKLVIKDQSNPESINSPKEWLRNASRAQNNKPIYVHTVHNSKIAEHISFDIVAKKCPSFSPIIDFASAVVSGK